MKIHPDYNKKPLCYFCNKNNATEDSALSKTVHGVTKSRLLPLSVDYISIDVEIPRCNECKKVHDKFNIWYTIVFFISIFPVGWFFMRIGWFEGEWYNYVFAIAATVVISTILTGIIGLPLKILSFYLFSRDDYKCKDDDDLDDYAPLQKLYKCGFTNHRPDAAASQKDDINKDMFKKAIVSIREEDNCNIISE